MSRCAIYRGSRERACLALDIDDLPPSNSRDFSISLRHVERHRRYNAKCTATVGTANGSLRTLGIADRVTYVCSPRSSSASSSTARLPERPIRTYSGRQRRSALHSRCAAASRPRDILKRQVNQSRANAERDSHESTIRHHSDTPLGLISAAGDFHDRRRKVGHISEQLPEPAKNRPTPGVSSFGKKIFTPAHRLRPLEVSCSFFTFFL